MRKRNVFIGFLFTGLAILYLIGCQKKSDLAWQEKLGECQRANKYAILFLANGRTEQAKAMSEILDAIARGHAEHVRVVDVNYEKEKESLLSRFKPLRSVELPAALIIAPNGAVTGLFAKQMDQASIENSLVSEKEADLILSLQKGQVVFLCLYDHETSELDNVRLELNGIETYFKGMATVMYVDIAAAEEAPFLKKLPDFKPIAVLTIVPPGQIIGKYEGDQIKQQTMLTALLSACGSGCGSGCK